MGLLFTTSPFGGLIATWTNVGGPVRTGIAIQFAVAVVAVMAGMVAERSFRRMRAERLAECAETASSVGQRTTTSPEATANVESATDYSVPSKSGDDT
ncbi:MAG: hypothetical protein GXP29_02730 [Planctomycetes bacterium]|nr:hypothetical protein [Planctomycetota bacterium]